MTTLEKIKSSLLSAGLDAIYITSAENHLYSCSFSNPDGEVLITKNKSYVFADFRYIEAARRECAEGFEVVMPKGGADAALPELLYENDVSTLGFEEDVMSFKRYSGVKEKLEKLEKTEKISLVPASRIMSELRVKKTRDEADKIIKAQRTAEAALEALIPRITYNMTEREVAAELEYLMKKLGSEDESFKTIAVSGKNSSSPHGEPRDVKLEAGFLTLDFGAVVGGYHSDMTRTLVVGKADGEMKRLYNTVLRAQEAALEIISEGTSNFEADKAARDIIENAGYHGAFGHSLGHGVGLMIHEAPSLSPSSPKDAVLREGEIVTVEPGIYLEGKYGCRIEDMVYITRGGAENLTKFTKELIEI